MSSPVNPFSTITPSVNDGTTVTISVSPGRPARAPTVQ
jgi:hypothetical protein